MRRPTRRWRPRKDERRKGVAAGLRGVTGGRPHHRVKGFVDCRFCSPPPAQGGIGQVGQSLRRSGGPRARPSGRRAGTRPRGPTGRRGHLDGGRGAHAPAGGLVLSRGGSHGDSQQAAINASNSARTRSSSPSARSRKTSAPASVCWVVTVIDLTSSTTTSPRRGVGSPGQASICLRSLSLAISILRGLACSAIGIFSVSTPAS